MDYFSTKLGMIHKRAGLRFLNNEYRIKANDDRYKGYHCFSDKGEVQMRFDNGKPLSCFVLDGNFDQVHVAYHSKNGRYISNRGSGSVTFTTFKYSTSDLHYKEAGVHFCRFVQISDERTEKLDMLNITHYALMLPLLQPRKDVPFQRQFTLIYDDWDVLRCDMPIKRKGKASTKNDLFNAGGVVS